MSTVSKVLRYLQDREGEEVTPEELMAAGIFATQATLRATMSRLALSPRSGVHYVGDRRRHGTRRSFRYERVPPPPEAITVQVLGTTTDGHQLVRNEVGEIFTLVRIGTVT